MESKTPSDARMRRVRRRRWCGGRSASRERTGIKRERFGALGDGGVAMELPPVASLEGPVRIGRLVGAARHTRGSATGVYLRALPVFGTQGTRIARISCSTE